MTTKSSELVERLRNLATRISNSATEPAHASTALNAVAHITDLEARLARAEEAPAPRPDNARADDAVERVFQSGVDRWMDACFGEPIKSDQLELADRFTEEALELAQTMPGFTKDRAHALVDYVFDRPQGEINQEVGGVMVTLAALCNTTGVDIASAAAAELARVWTKVEQIRAKQAAKPTGSALPIAVLSTLTPSPAVDLLREARTYISTGDCGHEDTADLLARIDAALKEAK